MDQIVALIRDSRFVVADLTLNRGGVYYEAGFAFGLGTPVIPTCREDHLDEANTETKIHFDVRHLNVLTWNDGKLPEFRERLKTRIEAVLGRGPLLTG
jgi:nucleoside 2-deoxyribosyltransferase